MPWELDPTNSPPKELSRIAEFTEVYQIETDFTAKVESEFNKMIATAAAASLKTK